MRREIVGMGDVGIGGDPGELAGAVAVYVRGLRVVGSWAKVKRAGRDAWSGRTVRLMGPAYDVDEWLAPSIALAVEDVVRRAGLLPDVVPVAIERITSHRGRTNGLTTLAESAGELRGAVSIAAHRTMLLIDRPMPSVWRESILGLLSTTDAKTCARSAIGAVRGHHVTGRTYTVDLGIGWPDDVPINDHEADAICLAVYAAGGRLGEPVAP